jgi:hypothetical protein
MSDERLVTLLSAAFSVFHTVIQLQQGAAYSDNHRDVSEAALEADAVAAAIWNTLRTKPEGFARSRRDQEEINKYPAETRVVRRSFTPARKYQPSVPGQCVGRSPTAFAAMGKRPAQTLLNFQTIGEA